MSNMDAYRELFERSADCFLIIEGDRFVDCNAAAVETFGASTTSEMLSVHPSDLSPPLQPDGRDSYEKANEMIRIAFDRGSHRFEWEHRRLSGEVFSTEVLLTAISEPGRRVLHSVVRDVSERKRLESELRHAQKMEAIGKLAGGIAHDFNNLLVVMLGGCDMLETTPLDNEAEEYVRQIREAGERGAGLVRQLLTFSRKQEVPEENLDLSTVVEEMMKMLKRVVGEHIDLSVSTTGPAVIYANRNRVEQVLLNLVNNAQDAMPDGGVLNVDVRRNSASPGWVELRVADTGHGMSEEVRRKAFEPFFTTKSMSEGTGLGLATVSNIVEHSRGEIAVETEPGRGTEIVVRFLEVEGRAAEQIRSEADSMLTGGAAILLVEDDSAIREMVRVLLSSAGFEVITAKDGEDGLRVAGEHRGDFDLIMTDVVMPRLGGPEMILRLRSQGHEVPVIFMSGYTDAKLESLGEHLDLIEKPFNLQTLVDRVRKALEEARAAA